MDKEVVELCDAINVVDSSIETVESCCGHGKEHFRIWVCATHLEALPELLYWFDGCHSGEHGWTVSIYTDCGMSFPTLLIESPTKGKEAYESAGKIAKIITDEYGKK